MKNRTRVNNIVGALLFSLMLMACAHPPTKPAAGIPVGDYTFLGQKISWMAERQLNRDVAGLSVVLIDGRSTAWERGFGFADAEQDVPVDSDTVFEVGSISKLFTAIAVMQLVEEGRIDLDAPLTNYLPAFTLNPPTHGAEGWSLDQITPRTIMTHHSGIPGDFLDTLFSSEPHPFQEYVERLRDLPATFPPRTALAYSNNAMVLLGHVVEKVSGQPFERYIEEHILIPAGMRSSSFAIEASALENVSEGFRDGDVQERLYINAIPAGSLRASARDLAKFAKLMLAGGGDILSADSLQEMWTRQNADVPLDLEFEIGLNWFLTDLPGVGKVVGHDGGTAHFVSSLMIAPDLDIAVVVLTNSAEGSPHEIAREAMMLAAETKRGRTGTDGASRGESASAESQQTTEDVESHTGHYQTVLGHIYLEAHGQTLRGRAAGINLELRPDGARQYDAAARLLGLFRIQPTPLDEYRFEFVDVGDRHIIGFRRSSTEALSPGGIRLDALATSSEWLARLGHYEPTSESILVESGELEIDHGMLRLLVRFKGAPGGLGYALEPLDGNRAMMRGLGRNAGDVLIATDHPDGVAIEIMGLQLEKGG